MLHSCPGGVHRELVVQDLPLLAKVILFFSLQNILSLLFLSNSVFGFDQTLTLDSLYISDLGDSEMVEVTVVASKAVYFTYIGSNYTVNSNEINLSVCYYFPEFTSPSETAITKKLYIFLPVGITNFTLNLNLYNSQSSTSCDYYESLDSASLNFMFPLTDTVFLATPFFVKKNDLSLQTYPNPAQNTLNINTNGKILNQSSYIM